jgi:hypothetical protein
LLNNKTGYERAQSNLGFITMNIKERVALAKIVT